MRQDDGECLQAEKPGGCKFQAHVTAECFLGHRRSVTKGVLTMLGGFGFIQSGSELPLEGHKEDGRGGLEKSWNPHDQQTRLIQAGRAGVCLGSVGTRGNVEILPKRAVTCSTLDMIEER